MRFESAHHSLAPLTHTVLKDLDLRSHCPVRLGAKGFVYVTVEAVLKSAGPGGPHRGMQAARVRGDRYPDIHGRRALIAARAAAATWITASMIAIAITDVRPHSR